VRENSPWAFVLIAGSKRPDFLYSRADVRRVLGVVYVDDLLIAGPSKEEIGKVKERLSKRFDMTDLGECLFYLGMEIRRDRRNRVIRLSQKAYVDKILVDFGMLDSKPGATLIDVSTLSLAPEGFQATESSRRVYASAIGSLMYLMLGTRPDIAYSVSCLSRFMANPTDAHATALKRVFRYLNSTRDLELVYRGNLYPIQGNTDADLGGDINTRRSTSGYLFNVESGVISWSSKRQPTVDLSSCESEYMGQTLETKEAIWLRRLLNELLDTEEPVATVIFGDNQGAIALSKNPQHHARTKHIDI
jgi:hypothetical protein